MPRVVGSVCVVACPARPSFHLVHVHKVKIAVAISKIGHRRGNGVFCDILLMTHEAELVIVRIIRSIEELREELPEHPEIL